jgi:hypothetical protein
MDKKDFINMLYEEVKEGQELEVSRFLILDNFICGFPTIYNTPEEAFLSSMIGSSWGVWRIRKNVEKATYIISRHSESSFRYYVDPDRAHLFKPGPDNTLIKR